MKKPVLAGILFALVVLGVLVYSSFHLSAYAVEICMNYKGNSACATSKGADKQTALESAMQTACAQIASGVTDTIGCARTEPAKETWLK
jgi:hypothetical protein